MAGHNKATKGESEKRKAIILEMLLAGMKRRDIIENITKKTDWGIHAHQIDKYIKAGNDEILKYAKIDNDKAIGKALARFDYCYRQLVKSKDFRGATLANEKEIRFISDITGIRAPDKIALTDPDGNATKLPTVIFALHD